MSEDELQRLMRKLGTPDPEWQAFIDSLPDKYWAKYDLSALRLGWEAYKQRSITKITNIDMESIEYRAFAFMQDEENARKRHKMMQRGNEAYNKGLYDALPWYKKWLFPILRR